VVMNRCGELLFMVSAIFCPIMLIGQEINNDQDAYLFCNSARNSFIAIVWPIAQGKDNQIEQLLNKFGTVMYRKKMLLSPWQAVVLLTKAHQHIVTNMKKHVKWYFPSSDIYTQKARIYVVTFKNALTAKSCKQAVRNLFHLQYRSIHINDTHKETREFAGLLFNNFKRE